MPNLPPWRLVLALALLLALLAAGAQTTSGDTLGAAGLAASGRPPSPQHSDNFNGPQLQPFWAWHNEVPNDHSLRDGALQITTRGGDIVGSCRNAENLLTQPAPVGDFEIVVELTLEPTANYQQGGILIVDSIGTALDLDNYIKLTLGWNNLPSGQKRVELYAETNGSVPFLWPRLGITDSQAVFLRLARAGNIYTGYYSADGTNWQLVGQHNKGFSAPRIGLIAVSGVQSAIPVNCNVRDSSIRVDFDRFDVTLDDGSTGKLPVIFIPGIEGSRLDIFSTAAANQQVESAWPAFVNYAFRSKLTLDPDEAQRHVYAVDVIRSLDLANIRSLDVYEGLLAFITAQGYPEYPLLDDPRRILPAACESYPPGAPRPHLFVFPYDWRKSVTENALTHQFSLAKYIECIRKLHPDTQVDIVAHSMGGMVAAAYIEANPGVVRNLVTLGTPYLGAGRAMLVMENGQQFPISPFLIPPWDLKQLAEHFPGAHELLPGDRFFAYQSPAMIELGLDYNGNWAFFDQYTFSDYVVALNRRFDNNVGTFARDYHTTHDGWNSVGLTGNHYVVHGLPLQADFTPVGMIATLEIVCYDRLCLPLPDYQPIYGEGDGTTPTISALRGAAPYVPVASNVVHFCVESSLPFIGKADHGSLPQNSAARELIRAVLADEQPGGQACTARAAATPAHTVALIGADGFTLTGGNGISVTLKNGLLSAPLPTDVLLSTDGRASHHLILPVNHAYTITWSLAANQPTALELSTGTPDNPTSAVRYRDLGVDTPAEAQLTLSDARGITLALDTNRDGSFETPVTPSAAVSGPSAADITPPTVEIVVTRLDTARARITLRASDSGIGVRTIRYALDDGPYTTYDGRPFEVTLGTVATVYAFADDHAANRSPLMAQSTRDYRIFVPVVRRQ